MGLTVTNHTEASYCTSVTSGLLLEFFILIMGKFCIAIVLVLVVGALATPTRYANSVEDEKSVEATPVDIENLVEVEKTVVAEPIETEKPVETETPVVAEPVEAEKPVVAEPVEAEKPVVAELVEAEEPVQEVIPEHSGHLNCLKNAKWAPAKLIQCGKKIFHCLFCLIMKR